MKNEKTNLDQFSAVEICTKEMSNVKGGVEYHHGSNSTGEYVWWYGDDGNKYGYYTSYYA